jgi:hypothetical protein
MRKKKRRKTKNKVKYKGTTVYVLKKANLGKLAQNGALGVIIVVRIFI